jgi:lipid-A-disaccharide synthase
MTGGEELCGRLGIASDAPLLVVLPGSRLSEVKLLLPRFREAVRIIAEDIPNVVCILATVPHVSATVREMTKEWPAALHIVETEADKFAAFDAADVALAASGTVTTELALAGTPMVVAYRLGWLTFALARPFIRVRFVTLANIILGRAAVPELIQHDCTGESLARRVVALFRDPQARERQRRDLSEATALLGAGGEPPSLRAARALLDFVSVPPQ